MEAQSTNEPSQFDLVDWLSANYKQVAIIIGGLVVVGCGIGIYSWSKDQAAIKANEQVFTVPSIGLLKGASADTYIKAAKDNSGNPVGERAELLAAGVLFEQGKYGDAQTQFEQFLKNHTDSSLQSEAVLGVAACLDAEGKGTEAAAKYQDVANRFANTAAASQAKLSLARLYEAQNKPDEALKLYDQLEKTQNPYDSWRASAVEKREALLSKHPELAKVEAQPGEQLLEVTTPPAGSTNAPIIKNVTPPASSK